MIGNIDKILNQQITGLHEYSFEPLGTEPRLIFASQNLCEMTGFTKEELELEEQDGYLLVVHEDDREKYRSFLLTLAENEGSESLEYRLITKSGEVICVKDVCVSSRNEKGEPSVISTLTDITDIKSENEKLALLNGNLSCGFLKYTCEKNPKIVYINHKMEEILRVPEDAYSNAYRENIFLQIPVEERRMFSKYLDKVYATGSTFAGEISLLRFDGTRAKVFGWVTKVKNENGVEEFQSVCIDITENSQKKSEKEAGKYIKALGEVYDKIFEINRERNTIACIHCNDFSLFKRFEGVPMQIDNALEKGIIDGVREEDQQRVRDFFDDFLRNNFYAAGAKPPQIRYGSNPQYGESKQYIGVFIKIDETINYFCCRKLFDSKENETLRSENLQLKEGMKSIVSNFSDGIAAFEVSKEGLVKPLYTSTNLCDFFGYTEKEWLDFMENGVEQEAFLQHQGQRKGKFLELLRKGDEEFDYVDHNTKEHKRLKVICSNKGGRLGIPMYFMFYNVDEKNSAQNIPQENSGIFARTFGYFDVFVKGKPVAFRNKKSKELLALLIDRKGGFVTSEEAISCLWEDEPVNRVTLSRYRKTALRLKSNLEEYGIQDIVESVNGKRRVICENFQCDLYDYLAGSGRYDQTFKGSYLTNYSWGETTLAELLHEL